MPGVGTLDLDEKSEEERKKIIDAGDDMLSASLATGLFDAGSAFVKWQSLLRDLKSIIDDLSKKGVYKDITHLAFDVFGFSRGAALARHFINALNKMGFPDYDSIRETDWYHTPPGTHPNLLGSTHYERYNANNDGYHADSTRTTSIRFVGLLDTVGSFYWPGNEKEGEIELELLAKSANRVLHITAHNEYRTKFPLTSLKTKGKLPPNFYEEVFPGAHSDVGGGYPFSSQYKATELAPVFGSPTNATYQLELVKVTPLHTVNSTLEDRRKARVHGGNDPDIDIIRHETVKRISIEWDTQSFKGLGIRGRVTHDHTNAYYYYLQPMDASLAGLAQERLKQQAELVGVEWNMDKYAQTEDYMNNKPVQALWETLSSKSIGSIQIADWQAGIVPMAHQVIHRSHDLATHIGFNDTKEVLVNGVKDNGHFIQRIPDQTIGTPVRNVYDNNTPCPPIKADPITKEVTA